MNYDAIAALANVTAIQEFDQGKQAVANRIGISGGVCRALAIMWLRSKRDNTDFWAGKDTVKQPLLADVNRLEDAVDLQAEYAAALQSRFVPDPATVKELSKSGVSYSQDDVTASAQEGFADELPSDEPAKIAAKVLGATSRFYILSAKGTSGGHSIAIHRPYKLIGKSSDAYLFDPNIGEFKVTGTTDLRSLLLEVNTLGYAAINVDLNQSYILWSFAA